MSSDTFEQQMEAARQRLQTLQARAQESVDPGMLTLEALEELAVAMEELHVGAEELRQRNEELAATREAVDAERQRYQELFEFAPDGYLVTDPDGVIREANRAAAILLGVRPGFLAGKPLSVFVVGADRAALEERLAHLQAAPESLADWQLRLHPRERAPFPAAVTVGVVRDGAGRVTGLRWLIHDITERQRLEGQLAHERDRLRLLLDVTTSAVSSLDLRGVFQAVSTSLQRLAPCDAVLVLLPDSRGSQLRLLALDPGESKGVLWDDVPIQVEGPRVGQVFRTGEPLVLESPQDLEFPRAPTTARFKSACALPLIHRTRVIGVLVLGRSAGAPFPTTEVEFLLRIAAQVAIAVANAQDYHQVIEARERLVEERRYLQDEIRTEYGLQEVVGESAALKGVLKQVEQVAPTDSTVLILGETGAGKERVARAIHDRSLRRDKSFIKVNCAAIPLGLLESELFGHERGAFTGAIARKVGRFELAHQGTLFLDEVGDIPLELQPKLLRVLQDQEFERLGSTRTQRVDVRLVAATNRDLAQMIAARQFREDLFYRLNVFPIRVPPLRDRPEDIPCLVRHFVSLYARRMDKAIDSISPGDMEAFARYAWPGNVRELQNFVERAVILASDRVLHLPLSDLPQIVEQPPAPDTTLGGVEREHILRALQGTNWVVGGPKGAAAYLGLKRTTLRYKMERLGILRRSR